MAFRSEVSWSIQLNEDSSADHSLDIKALHLDSRELSADRRLYIKLPRGPDTAPREFKFSIDGNPVPGEFDGESQVVIEVDDIARAVAQSTGVEPQDVSVAKLSVGFVQRGAVRRQGPMRAFDLTDFSVSRASLTITVTLPPLKPLEAKADRVLRRMGWGGLYEVETEGFIPSDQREEKVTFDRRSGQFPCRILYRKRAIREVILVGSGVIGGAAAARLPDVIDLLGWAWDKVNG